jgi:DNA-binding transcriptional regulator YiaG
MEMTAVAKRRATTIKRQVALEQAIALLNLSPDQVAYIRELRDLFQKSLDDTERNEIRDALLEIICPEGVGAEGNFGAGVSKETKARIDEYHGNVGKKIRRRREALELTQAKLARMAGIPQSHVSRLEAGKHTPTHITIKKLAKALKTQPKMLDPGFDA